MASEEKNVHQLAASEKLYLMDHYKALDIDSDPIFPRLTGLICTIGPASQEVNTLLEMLKAGMNVVRVNFSHGTYEYHESTMKNAREAIKKFAEEKGMEYYPVAIALDTKGPEIRTGLIEKGENAEVELVKGKTVKVTTDDAFFKKCSADVIYIDYKNITKFVQKGSRIYIDDGQLCLIVKSISPNSLECEIENGGMLSSEKGCNLPGIETDLPATSERDKNDLLFGVEKEMLESMHKKPRPTRAESSDVANAVLDGADCVMLSGESAKGEYPVVAVKVMHSICREAEAAFYHRNIFSDLLMETPLPTDQTTAIGIAAVVAAMKHRASAIIVLTVTGRTAHVISKYRPRCPIITITRDSSVAKQAVMYRGIIPILFTAEKLSNWKEDKDEQIKYSIECSKKQNILKKGQTVLIVSGSRHGPDTTNSVCFHKIE
ncbi:pyruvate kinase PKM-like isoform X3 [Argiope bruennichi]|uniref:pyruvate kinase PKM-like isoform X3 n=1 Tax=Argiope bruennichi TaxID=94029 RepID=UPI002495679C|nr:pyruvate kinase PKM-like isoform X3 [Argiope bruennichi]